jgi:hypothetical protein
MARTRGVRVARLLWGASLLAAPCAVMRFCEPGSPRGVSTGVARLLGAREISQGLLFEGKRYRRTGAIVEGLHGLSMLWAAGRFPVERRCAFAAAAVSGLLVTAELAT